MISSSSNGLKNTFEQEQTVDWFLFVVTWVLLSWFSPSAKSELIKIIPGLSRDHFTARVPLYKADLNHWDGTHEVL